jgi:hypothetical protein
MTDDSLLVPTKPGDMFMNMMGRIVETDDAGKVQGHNRAGWQWNMIIAGLSEAIVRYKTAVQGSSGLAARVAVGEALWWIAAADEFLRNRVSDMNGNSKTYYTELGKTTAGGMLGGLAYLRNRTGHQYALALTDSEAASASASFNVIQKDGSVESNTVTVTLSRNARLDDPSPEGGFHFAPLGALSAPGYPETSGRDKFYEREVAGKPVGDILDATEKALRGALAITYPTPTSVHIAITCHPIPGGMTVTPKT